MANYLINVGFNNMLASSRVVAVVSPLSSPIRRMKEESKSNGRLIDVTQGRKTRSIITMDSGYIILSALSPETISQRMNGEESKTRL